MLDLPVKTLVHPELGKTFKLGRNAPVALGPRLSLGNYLYRKFPAPPPMIDYSPKAMKSLLDVYGNDVAGCCTLSSAYHLSGTALLNAGSPVGFGAADVLRLYMQLAGWDGADDATDTGLDELTVLNYWMDKGLPNDANPISGYIAVDATDVSECQAAMWLFTGGLYITASLPDQWVHPMPQASGFLWDTAGDSNPQNGHAFCGVGYPNRNGVLIDTWGMLGTLTWDALAKYCNVYAVLTLDSINRSTQIAPNNFNSTQLISDLQSMGSKQL